jgi:oxygen-independent coproporphyrinogen III oxidase
MATPVRISRELLDRYDRPGPRYTSYPPIPSWSAAFDEADYRAALTDLATRPDEPVAVYVHLPFCVARCWYCGCNATVTRHEHVQEAYVDRVLRELDWVIEVAGGRRRANEMQWGGGTPNYLGVAAMERLAAALHDRFDFVPGATLAIEIDPRVASVEQIGRLRHLGFNRLSIGIQDFDEVVQESIGRKQSQETVLELRVAARDTGFTSVNFDLVYGLPGQNETSFRRTLDDVIAMNPDRVACFGYAHVPWVRPNQNKIDASRLPDRYERFALFQLAVETFTSAGYRWIGLDHFARAGDELAVALDQGRLRRNFMGYVPEPASHLLAFGSSGIGEVAGRFVQNDAHLGSYQRAIDAGHLPVVRGHVLTEEDRIRRAAIERLLCTGELPYSLVAPLGLEDSPLERFRPFADEGFVEFGSDRLTVAPAGRFFLRNLAMELDAYAAGSTTTRFSRTV